MTRPVYITAAGSFLPGPPVANDDIEKHLGQVGGKPSRLKRRILEANGITSRHYAMDREGRPTMLNEEMAAAAVADALAGRGLSASDVEMLSLGTTIPDLLMPGFASMVHGRLGGGPMEVLSAGGVCCSGQAALRAAVNAVRAGDHDVAVAGASELPSAPLKASRFERESEEGDRRDNAVGSFRYFNADFLRWMLSDGAGAVVLEAAPHPDRPSLRVEWITLRSYAHRFDTCMYLGTSNPGAPAVGNTFMSQPTFADAEREGLMIIRQDVKLLETGLKETVPTELKRLMRAGRIDPTRIDWFLPHISSYFFFDKLKQGFRACGFELPEERWFTNLRDKGNTGAAAIYIMLAEALNEGRFRPGQQILTMVPESGRFSVSFGLFTCVAPGEVAAEDASRATPHVAVPALRLPRPAAPPGARSGAPRPSAPTLPPEPAMTTVTPHATRPAAVRDPRELAAALDRSPLGARFADTDDPIQKFLAVELALVWSDFMERLSRVPIVRAIEDGTATREDYLTLLRNLRQQVIEGGRWIAQTAASMDQELFLVRSVMIGHAAEEHRDYQMLEANYVAAGGRREDIVSGVKNVGSEALSSFMFHHSREPNPLDLFGAMFIIEGLGSAKAATWARKLRQHLDLPDEAVSFLAYHGENDDAHYDKLRAILSAPFITGEVAERIVKTARVLARLYCLQLEELDHV